MIIQNKDINDFMDKFETMLKEMHENFPMDALTAPGWLCLDIALTNQLNHLKRQIQQTVMYAVSPETIKHNFEQQINSLAEEAEKEMETEEENEIS